MSTVTLFNEYKSIFKNLLHKSLSRAHFIDIEKNALVKKQSI